MCEEAKINSFSLVSPDLYPIEQLSSGDSSGIIQCYLGILDSFRLLSIKKWAWIPYNVVRRYILSLLPRYDAVIAAGNGHAVFEELLYRRERDIHYPVKNLSFLKMTLCLNTSKQRGRI